MADNLLAGSRACWQAVQGSMTSAHHTQASGPCKPAVAAASGRCIDGNTRALVHTH